MLLIFASGTGPFGSVKHRIGDTTGKWIAWRLAVSSSDDVAHIFSGYFPTIYTQEKRNAHNEEARQAKLRRPVIRFDSGPCGFC